MKATQLASVWLSYKWTDHEETHSNLPLPPCGHPRGRGTNPYMDKCGRSNPGSPLPGNGRTKVRIENASGRKFTVPLTGFSSADQEYVKKAYGRSLFAEPQPFEG